MKLPTLICALLFIYQLTYALDSPTQYIKNVLSSSQGDISRIWLSEKAITNLQNNLPDSLHYHVDLILKKNRNSFYFIENGSGRTIQTDSMGNWERIDKTKYSGDRFGAYTFIYNDTLFSIGGYGYWRVTGALRYFDEYTREWSIIRLNKNIQIAEGVNALFHFNSSLKKLFVIYQYYPDEYITSNQPISNQPQLKLAVLNLQHKQWEETNFIISPTLAKNISDLKIIAFTNQEIFVHSKHKRQGLALNLLENIFTEYNEAFFTRIAQIRQQIPLRTEYSSDTSYYIYDLEKRQHFEIPISKYRSSVTHQLYFNDKSLKKDSKLEYLLFISLFINLALVFTNAVFILKLKKKSEVINQDKKELEDIAIKPKKFIDLLEDEEYKVFSKLIENYKIHKRTSIEEINHILNLESRHYKIRNNIRADVLKSINKKFSNYLGVDETLVIRIKSDFDKRFFEYHINDRFANKTGIRIE